MPLCNWFTAFVRIKKSDAHDIRIEDIVDHVEFKLTDSFPNGKEPRKVYPAKPKMGNPVPMAQKHEMSLSYNAWGVFTMPIKVIFKNKKYEQKRY